MILYHTWPSAFDTQVPLDSFTCVVLLQVSGLYEVVVVMICGVVKFIGVLVVIVVIGMMVVVVDGVVNVVVIAVVLNIIVVSDGVNV
jgi:hypothetical protein